MSLVQRIMARWGSGAGEVDDVRIDASTNVLTTIDYAHHEIHSGSSFHAYINATGGSGTKGTITFITPDTTTYMHAFFYTLSNVAAKITFGEGATVTAASGTDFPALNRNRNLAATSTATVLASGSAGGAGNVTTGATVTGFGTILKLIEVGIGKSGGEVRSVDEWVLKRNTVYALEIESQAASSEVTAALDWYEHADKH